MQESVIDREIIQTGRQEGEVSLIRRQISRRLEAIEASLIQQIEGLSIAQLECLGEALLDFTTVDDLVTWLNNNR